MSFGSFEDDVHDGDGVGWASCKCGRWLHNDCVEDFVVNKRGVELFCPFCTDGYVAYGITTHVANHLTLIVHTQMKYSLVFRVITNYTKSWYNYQDFVLYINAVVIG